MAQQTYKLEVTHAQLQTILSAVRVHQDVTIDSLGESDNEQYSKCMETIAQCAITIYEAEFALNNWKSAPWHRFEANSAQLTRQEAQLVVTCLTDLTEINDEAIDDTEDEATRTDWSVNRFCIERIINKLQQG